MHGEAGRLPGSWVKRTADKLANEARQNSRTVPHGTAAPTRGVGSW
jgi:hypothetical protein